MRRPASTWYASTRIRRSFAAVGRSRLLRRLFERGEWPGGAFDQSADRLTQKASGERPDDKATLES